MALYSQPIDSLYQLPVPQAGGLACVWRNSTSSSDFEVSVLPNASASLSAASATLQAFDDGTGPSHQPHVPKWGDESWTHCLGGPDDPPEGCDFEIRVGSFWIEASQRFGNTLRPYPLSAGIKDLLTRTVSAIRSAPAVSVWRPDVTGLTLPTTCAETLSTATVRADTGAPAATVDDALRDFGPFLDGAFSQTGSLNCSWNLSTNTSTDADLVTLFMVPGSTWAWTSTSGPPAHAFDVPLTAMSGLGSAAFGACAHSTYAHACDLYVLANHTWFEFKEDFTSKHNPSLAASIALAKSYLALIGFTS